MERSTNTFKTKYSSHDALFIKILKKTFDLLTAAQEGSGCTILMFTEIGKGWL